MLFWFGIITSTHQALISRRSNVRKMQIFNSRTRLGYYRTLVSEYIQIRQNNKLNLCILWNGMLFTASRASASFDLILLHANDDTLYALLLKFLKPNGTLYIATAENKAENLRENLQLSGFININATSDGKSLLQASNQSPHLYYHSECLYVHRSYCSETEIWGGISFEALVCQINQNGNGGPCLENKRRQWGWYYQRRWFVGWRRPQQTRFVIVER